MRLAAGGARLGALLSQASEEGKPAEDGEDDHDAKDEAQGGADPAERQRDELDDAEAERDERNDQQDDEDEATRLDVPRGAGRRGKEAHDAQQEQLAAGRRRLAEALDGF